MDDNTTQIPNSGGLGNHLGNPGNFAAIVAKGTVIYRPTQHIPPQKLHECHRCLFEHLLTIYLHA